MSIKHGVYVTESDSALSTPRVAESGIPFIVGVSPIQAAENPASIGAPVLVTSWSEAVEKFGYDSDWATYPLCEAMYTFFKLYGVGPLILMNLLDPSSMKTTVAATSFDVSDHKAKLPGEAVNNNTLVVKSGDNALTAGTDYEAYYSGDALVVELLSAGGYYSASTLSIAYTAVTPASVTTAMVASAFENVDLCMSTLGITPDILLAPGYSDTPTTAAVMATKAEGINGLFRAIAVIDMPSGSGGVTTYSAASAYKTNNSLTDDYQLLCWPMCKYGDYFFHMSTQIAALMCSLDADNEGVPYESPSNRAMKIDSLYLADGTTEVLLTKAQADILNAAGIVTAINFINGWTAWGNDMACYPANTDVKDYFITNRRMFNWVGNTEIKTFWGEIDMPMTRMRIDSIINSLENWMSGLVNSGYLLGARVEFLDEENTVTDLAAGKVVLHNYLTPPSPMQELDFVLEYDASYVTAAFSS